ncbi:MAG: cobalt ECF transporter T component CbiQ [Desulfohalobium sp.]
MALHTDHITSTGPPLDPRVRLVVACLLSVTIALLSAPAAAGVSLLVAVVFCPLLGVRIAELAPRLAAVNLFVLFIWAVLPWSVQGRPLAAIGPLQFTSEGVQLALLVTLKANAIMILFLAFICTLPLPHITTALRDLKVPAKLCQLLSFTFRFIFVLDEERRRLLRAARNRGFRPGTNRHTYTTYAHIVGMVLVKSWERAERVQQAMLCRGFSGKYPHLPGGSLTMTDYWFCAAGLGVIVLLVALQLGGFCL